MKRNFLKDNGLSIVLLLMFIFTIGGHFIQGYHTNNEKRVEDKLQPLTKAEYLKSGHLVSSISENMESEFLQMALFVYLTRCFYQRGSAESKKLPDEKTPEDIIEEQREENYLLENRKKSPVMWRIYENSLTLSLLALFIIFFFLHAYGTMENINIEKVVHHEPLLNYWDTFSESEFWFESFQNWQSEFFSIAIMGIMSIFLRQKHSSQSKKLIDGNLKTGTD